MPCQARLKGCQGGGYEMKKRPDYYYRQSAVIPVRDRGGQLEILMITSRKGKRWVIPKGIVEPTLSPSDSAAKEALEEAGIVGVVLPDALGEYRYTKWGGTCSVQVFVMQVTQVREAWLEDFRSRVWLRVEEAGRRMKEEALRHMLTALSDHVLPGPTTLDPHACPPLSG